MVIQIHTNWIAWATSDVDLKPYNKITSFLSLSDVTNNGDNRKILGWIDNDYYFCGGIRKKREICCGPLLLLQRIRKQLSSDIDRYFFYFFALFHLIIYITCFECQNHFDDVRAKFYHVEDKVKSHVGSVMIPRIGYNLG